MKKIFLSASIPIQGRGDYFESANPFLIQFSVRELLTVCLGRLQIVWGGHPAITPMVWAVCEDLGLEYASSVTLYQSKFFEEQYPEENRHFNNVIYIDSVEDNRNKSLTKMRTEMLSNDIDAAVFIGGMEGIFEEFEIFSHLHPSAKVIPITSPGGAARELSNKLKLSNDRIDYANLFYEELGIDPSQPRIKPNILTNENNS